MRRQLALALACVLALGVFAASPASARSFAPQTVSISYADLDLGSEEGAAVFAGRIKAAARTVCGVNDGRMELVRSMRARSCVREAQERALSFARHALTDAAYAAVEQRVYASN